MDDVSGVRIVEADRDPRWDRFVTQHPDGTVYHLSAWSTILSRAYRFKPECLAVEGSDGVLHGVMPLLARKTPVRGSVLISLPWLRAGGPLATNEDAKAELLSAACELADEQGRTLTVDSAYGELDHSVPRFARVPCLPTWIASLPAESEIPDWFRGRSKNLRRGIKRAQDRGVTVRISDSEADLRDFFRLYLQTMRKHRSLPRPWRQLVAARRLLGPEIFRLFVAEREGVVIAGGVFHVFGETMDLLYNASDEGALDHRPNHALYNAVVEWAARNGVRKLDYGVAPPDGSLADFKRQWGGVEAPRYCYEHAGRDQPAGSSGGGEARMLSDRGRRIDSLWGKTPLALTRLAGLVSYRYL